MINNDILRRTRFALDLSDQELLQMILDGLTSTGQSIPGNPDKESLTGWLSKEADSDFVLCPDQIVHGFLDGLILKNRGPSQRSESASKVSPKPAADSTAPALTNNIVLKKLRIAFSLRSDDMLGDLARAGLVLSPSEFSALFRSPEHRKFKSCGDQVLRRFLQGLVMRLRPDKLAGGAEVSETGHPKPHTREQGRDNPGTDEDTKTNPWLKNSGSGRRGRGKNRDKS